MVLIHKLVKKLKLLATKMQYDRLLGYFIQCQEYLLRTYQGSLLGVQ